MVKTRHREKTILPVGWEPKDGRAEVEVLHLAELALRVPRAFERPEFHAFVVYTRGTSKHEIDFERIACRPGTLLHVRPGQVQRWHLREGVDGLALVFQPTLLASSAPSRASLASSAGEDLDLASWPTNVELGAIDLAAATDWLLRIERAATESRGAPRARALLRHLVSAALLDLARRPPFERAAQRLSSAVRVSLRRFEADIERSFRVTRTVGDYAARLGCSSRTLDRLARETSNVSAKRLTSVMSGPREDAVARALRRVDVRLPEAFGDWFRKAASASPDERFASAGESIRALGVALELPVGPARVSIAGVSVDAEVRRARADAPTLEVVAGTPTVRSQEDAPIDASATVVASSMARTDEKLPMNPRARWAWAIGAALIACGLGLYRARDASSGDASTTSLASSIDAPRSAASSAPTHAEPEAVNTAGTTRDTPTAAPTPTVTPSDPGAPSALASATPKTVAAKPRGSARVTPSAKAGGTAPTTFVPPTVDR